MWREGESYFYIPNMLETAYLDTLLISEMLICDLYQYKFQVHKQTEILLTIKKNSL